MWNKGGAYNTKITHKLNEIEELIKTNKIGVMGIAEANIGKDDKQEDITIKGYNTIVDKGRNKRDGVSRTAILIRKDLNYKLREDLMSENFPETWIELGEKGKQKILLCSMYREFKHWGEEGTVSDKEGERRLKEWFKRIEGTLESDKEIWIIGDWNADMNRRNDKTYSRRKIATLIKEEMEGRGFTQLIGEGTHEQGGKLSCIDLIFTNRPKKITNWGTRVTGGGHSMVHATRQSKYRRRKTQVRRRMWKNFTIENLKEETIKVNWEEKIRKTDTKENLDTEVWELEEKIREVIEAVAPIRVIKDDPEYMGDWFTDDLKKRRKERDDEKIRMIVRGKQTTEEEKKEWRKKRNKLGMEIKKAKKAAMKKRAENNLQNCGSMMNAVKDMLGWRSGGAPEMLISEGLLVREPGKMAEILQTTYKNKLEEVEGKVGEPTGNYLRILRNMTRGKVRTFRFKEVTEEQVREKIRNLPDKPSMGLDDISYGVIKRLESELTGPITRIINSTTRLGHHPRSERHGAVKPLYKGLPKQITDPKGYRPVQLLPAIGRIDEGIKADQMNEYSEEIECLPPGEHGYRRELGTITALLEMQEHAHQQIAEGMLVSVCFLDISAGFDTVPHTYLLRKLEMMGYENSALEWVASYLEDRTQVVQVEASYSSISKVVKGVPQGGPGSPIFWRDYTADIPMAIHTALEWRQGEKEDRKEIEKEERETLEMEVWNGTVSKRSLLKKDRDIEDVWDLITVRDHKYEHFLQEKTGIGPERRQVEKYEGSARATLYADDSSARESGRNVTELKEKTEIMLKKLFRVMRESRLAVNSDKTQILMLRTSQKKTSMIKRGETSNLTLEVEGVAIQEETSGKLLGLIWSSDLTWRDHIEDLVKRFGDKCRGIKQVLPWLGFKQRKELVNSTLVSTLRYGLELTSGGTEKGMKKLENLLSKAARMVLMTGKRNWSRTQGLKTIGWMTVTQMAIESSMRMFLKMLQNKKPQTLHEATTTEQGEVKDITENELRRMTKTRRKTWAIRCMRWYKILPADIRKRDIKKESGKNRLKEWILRSIDKKGDMIFRGKVNKSLPHRGETPTGREHVETDNDDWVTSELENFLVQETITREEDIDGEEESNQHRE